MVPMAKITNGVIIYNNMHRLATLYCNIIRPKSFNCQKTTQLQKYLIAENI